MTKSSYPRPQFVFRRGAIAALAMVVVSPILVLASSYTSTLSFTYSLEGKPRSYDGQDISISMTASYSKYHSLNKTFQVTLQRRNWYGGYNTIGTVNFARDGFTVKTWTNVGPGTYRFYFSKANDGITITSNDVKMFN